MEPHALAKHGATSSCQTWSHKLTPVCSSRSFSDPIYFAQAVLLHDVCKKPRRSCGSAPVHPSHVASLELLSPVFSRTHALIYALTHALTRTRTHAHARAHTRTHT
eukprot:2109443-Pleurochrysis_carterae.AAC.2